MPLVRAIRVLHPCLPRYDNLGDIAANEGVRPMFRGHGVELDLVDHDLGANPLSARYLDERIEEINSDFDLMMLGPGGFLGPKLIGSVCRREESWRLLTVPLCMNGIGVVASIGRPVWYTAMDRDTHVTSALRQAAVVSVRELNTWLLAARVMGQDSNRLLLTGCPSLQAARLPAPVPRDYELALNLSFVHEVCRNYISELTELLKTAASLYRRILWICHSAIDADQAAQVNRKLGLGFDVVRPRNAQEAGAAYAACEHALVTRFHAGMFCLANLVPFAFIGYDVKCGHLLSMIADEPHRYILPIDRLKDMDLQNELRAVQLRLRENDAPFRRAESLLRSWFDEQTDRFVQTAVASFSGRPASPARF